MVRSKRWPVLLCVVLLIATVILSCFLITSCGDDETTAPESTGEPNTPSVGAYQRPNTDGEQVSATVSAGVSGDLSSYTSPSGILVLDGSIYVSDETGKAVYKLSTEGSVQNKYTTSREVHRVVTDGTNIYALEGGLDGTVVKLSKTLEKVSEAAVGHTPNDMAIVGGKGYVVNRFSNTVSVLSLSDMKVTATIGNAGREPFSAVAVGNDIYVACHLANDPLTEDVVSADVLVISGDKIAKTIPLPNGSSSVKGIAVSPDGKTVYVTHIVGRYTFPTTQTDGAWINSNVVSVISTADKALSYSALLDGVDHGAGNPWGVAVSSDGKYLCVALAGCDEVEIINLSKMADRVSAVQSGRANKRAESMETIVDSIAFLEGARGRVKVGKGVRNITEVDGVLYCGLYFDGAVATVTLSNNKTATLNFVDQPEAEGVRRGQILWTDASVTYQNWESCASCHPEGRCDGLNWDQLSDGIGTPKSSKSIMWAMRTPPATFTGVTPKAEEDAQGSYESRGYLDLEGIACVFEYMKANMPVPSPALNRDGTLTASALEGKALFDKNCASCHPAPLYTDMKMHDVGTQSRPGETAYDTPSLVESWRSGPYLHEGTMNTMEEVVKYFAKDLSDADVAKLTEYVRSIGIVDELYGVEQVITTHADGSEICNTYSAGAKISGLTVRNQSANAPASVVVALSVFDKDGKQVYYSDSVISGVKFGDYAVITLAQAITLPAGGSYSVAIYNTANGEAVASPLLVK